jgi:hypothetical protein
MQFTGAERAFQAALWPIVIARRNGGGLTDGPGRVFRRLLAFSGRKNACLVGVCLGTVWQYITCGLSVF